MITRCPCRHIPYTSWRHQAFQWLFTTSCNPSAVPLFLTQPCLAGGRGRRGISISQRTLARDEVADKLRAASGRAIAGADKALERPENDFDQSDGIEIAASAAEHCLQSELGRVPRFEGGITSQLCRSASLEHDGHGHNLQDERVSSQKGWRHEKKLSKRRQKHQQWSPHNEAGNDDLHNLAAYLRDSLESLKSPGHSASEVVSQPETSSCLPVSPLVQALEHQKTTKTSARGAEKNELADNPWANMLASPMRLCSATGVRLPRDLLVPWGLVRNPETKEVYLMPTQLAEVDSLRDSRRSSKLSASAQPKTSTIAGEFPRDLTPDSIALQFTGDIDSDRKRLELNLSQSRVPNNKTEADARLDESPIPLQASESSSLRPTPSMIYMLPFLPLLHHLTLRFTSLQRDMVTRRSKPNAIYSILPWRLKASVDRANFYAEDRTKISPSALKRAGNVSSPGSFQYVKWEAEIGEVMLYILRERLLATLEMLGNRNQKLWRQECELVQAHRVMWTSDANNKERLWRLQSADDHDQPVAERGGGTDVKSTKICLLVESDVAIPPVSQHPSPTKQRQVDKEEATQVSDPRSSQSADIFAATCDSPKNYSGLEPSTIQLDQSSSIPLFSLNDLFGADHIARFRQLSTVTGVLAPRHLSPGDTRGHAYVLVVPTNAFGAKSVVEEVWRLWRFLGGRRA